MRAHSDIRIFSTCPQSRDVGAPEYAAKVADAARWSESAGCEGILVYTDNGIVDAWLLAQIIVQATSELAPLVAVQPMYLHPYSAAKMVASLAYIYDRRLYLNMVAGGFRNDLLALGDETPHDERYDRLVEYGRIVRSLVDGETVTFSGKYYNVRNLRLAPPVPPHLAPGFTVSGSSPAGRGAARALAATAVKYPQPPEEEAAEADADLDVGMRIGIMARADGEEAWRAAYGRFPEDRKGQIAHRYAMQISDSAWHRQLTRLAEEAAARDMPYWLGPFQNYRTFCPYLIGSYERVGEELARYIALGFRTFILDIPPDEDELIHTGVAFERARASLAT
jgi:alkanesulfonate monooxygenase